MSIYFSSNVHYNQIMLTNLNLSIKKKIQYLALSVAIPFLIVIVFLLLAMAKYNRTYEQIVGSMTIANNYNINFKEEMDESLYKLVVGYVTFDSISKDGTLKDPYLLTNELRNAFTQLMDMTDASESRIWLESLLRNIDTLEKRIDDIRESLAKGDLYDQNIEMLDNNIYILTELIQDDIQYFIYYQTQDMERITQKLQMQINRFIRLCSILVAIMVVVVCLITVPMVRGILRPVEELAKATKQVANGDFSARAHVYTKDEIAVLAEGFNAMAENMQSLIDEIKEDQQKLRQVDLRLLQEQINPHFLYNTLDTIVWLIEGNETDQAVDMVVTLSNFFRLTLSKGKEFISIREEEQHIRNYLEIQHMRYHDIMEFDIQIDQVLYQYQILKLTLQPLVENSLYHGLKYKRAKGYIHINGEKDGDCIRFTVRDNGVGMDEEELAQLQKEICKPCQETEKGFGLANVNERIRMHFGNEYGLRIESQKEKGTIVEVTIPAIVMK